MKIVKRLFFSGLLAALFMSATIYAQPPSVGKNSLVIREQQQDIYFLPASGVSANRKILFAPGDGGWRGFAITVAQRLASDGYDVYGLDTKHYLESFSGKTELKETEVMADFKKIAEWIAQGKSEPITLVGWSEGAGLCLLAAAGNENKKSFNGLLTFGLTESADLGWKWTDYINYFMRKEPDEPSFEAIDYMPKVAPLPLMMIQSSRDEYVTNEAAQKLFNAAANPKRFELIQAQNHRFNGNTEEFFRKLKEGLEWIGNTAR